MERKNTKRSLFGIVTYLSVFVFCSAFLGMCEKKEEVSGVIAGPSPTPSPVPTYKHFVFVTNSTENTVSSYVEDPSTGALTAVGAAANTDAGPGPIVVHPSGKFLYVLNQTAATVQPFAIDKTTGALTAIGSSVSSGSRSITIDPSGKWAYVVQYGTSPVSSVYMYSINSTTGVLTPTSPATVSVPAVGSFGPINLVVNPESTYAYVANNHDNIIHVYTIDSSTGVLTASSTLNPASNNSGGADHVAGITMDPAGKFVFGTNNQTPGGVDTYTIDPSTGALTWTSFLSESGTSGLGGLGPSAGVLDPAGKCFYVAGGGFSGVYAYSVNSTTGALSAVSGSPYSGPGKLPVVDTQGKFVYVAGPGNNLSVYSMDATTCALTPASPATVSTGAGPFGAAVAKIAQ